MNGKGSKRRPTFVPLHEFGDNWAKIFEKPKQKEEENVNSRDTELERGTEEGQPYRHKRAGRTIRTWLSNLPSTQRRTACLCSKVT